MARPTKEELIRKTREVKALREGGMSLAKAVAQVGTATATYYRNLKHITGEQDATVVVHAPDTAPKIKRNVREVRSLGLSAVFIGQPQACAQFLKEFS